MDADLDLDALLASFAGESAAVSDLIVQSPFPPPHDAEAGSPESVTSRSSPAGEEALSEIERFLMEEEAAAEGVEGISVDEFFDAMFDGGEGAEEGKGSVAGGSTDGDSGRVEEEVEVVTPETVVEVVETPETEVDGDDPVSKKKRRYANFYLTQYVI
jgi:hypothetical protein